MSERKSTRQKPSLGDFVRDTMKEKGLTGRQVERISGGKITNSYVSQIISGSSTNLTVDKVKALARGIGVPEKVLFDIIQGELPQANSDSELLSLVCGWKNLLEKDRAEMRGILKMVEKEIQERLKNQ